MRRRAAHNYHIHPCEALDKGEFEFFFRREDLLRTASLHSSNCAAEARDANVGRLWIQLERVNSGQYLANIEFSLSYTTECSYCLEPTECQVSAKSRVELRGAEGAESAGAYPFSDNAPFDCRFLFEEEILLHAPINPHHEACSIETLAARQPTAFATMRAASDGDDKSAEGSWRPFANIRALIDS